MTDRKESFYGMDRPALCAEIDRLRDRLDWVRRAAKSHFHFNDRASANALRLALGEDDALANSVAQFEAAAQKAVDRRNEEYMESGVYLSPEETAAMVREVAEVLPHKAPNPVLDAASRALDASIAGMLAASPGMTEAEALRLIAMPYEGSSWR